MSRSGFPRKDSLLRLDLKRYDREAPMGAFVDCSDVKIPLKMHIGGPDKALGDGGTAGDKGAADRGAGGYGCQDPCIHRRNGCVGDRRIHRDKEVRRWALLHE